MSAERDTQPITSVQALEEIKHQAKWLLVDETGLGEIDNELVQNTVRIICNLADLVIRRLQLEAQGHSK